MGLMLKRTFSEIVDATVDACRSVYGERLVGFVLYGSVARETMHHESDIDVLVVVEPLPQGRMARMREFAEVESIIDPTLAAARRNDVNTRMAPIIRTLDELDRSGFLVFDIACDGIVLHDRDGRVDTYMSGVRERLERRGAERRSFQGAPYWVLEPDVRPGQVVEI